MVRVEIKDINLIRNKKSFLKDVSFTIENGQYITIVGATDSGKSILVNIISGLYQPTSGKILFDGKDITKLPPNERYCGVMFESYALFPHLTILDNVGYARHVQGKDHAETHAMAREVLRLVRLTNRDMALPKECSGGIRQRVALARALMAIETGGLLILDEPFKALNAGLRKSLRVEVRNIAKSPQLNLTTIHVTNDMQEAVMGDKILVLDHGEVKQFGTPEEILYSPANLFVTDFFSWYLNYFNGKVIQLEDVRKRGISKEKLTKVIMQSTEGYFLYAKTEKYFVVGQEVTFLVRSHHFKSRAGHREDKTNSIVGKVKSKKFMGAWMRLEVEAPYKLDYLQTMNSESGEQLTQLEQFPTKILTVEVPTTKMANTNYNVNQTITVYYPSEYVIVLPLKFLRRKLRPCSMCIK